MKGLKIGHTKHEDSFKETKNQSSPTESYAELKKTSKKIIKKLGKDSPDDISMDLAYFESLLPNTTQLFEIGPEEGDILFFSGTTCIHLVILHWPSQYTQITIILAILLYHKLCVYQ